MVLSVFLRNINILKCLSILILQEDLHRLMVFITSTQKLLSMCKKCTIKIFFTSIMKTDIMILLQGANYCDGKHSSTVSIANPQVTPA